ncbi:ankyrin [Penicillium malachiteum]|uniref:ankyrin n=1 Tax=Penicillium malachiteum TaxID=1324776 RepID=UPI0025475405|nr:ankyrin [Penicillium malachiteum]KAJ5726761.1 ankyrin [Penicillium malachiteum]
MVHPPSDSSQLCRILHIPLNQGADPNSKDDNGQTPLHLAAQVGNIWAMGAMLEWALESGDAKYGDRDDAAARQSRYLDIAGVDNSESIPFHLLATQSCSPPEFTAIFLFLLTKVGGGFGRATIDGRSRCEPSQRLLRA